MNDGINNLLAMADEKEKMEQYGALDVGSGKVKLVNFIKTEHVKRAQLATDAKVTVDAKAIGVGVGVGELIGQKRIYPAIYYNCSKTRQFLTNFARF